MATLTGPPNCAAIWARLSSLQANRTAWSPSEPSSRRAGGFGRAGAVVVVVVELTGVTVVGTTVVEVVVLTAVLSVVELPCEAVGAHPASASPPSASAEQRHKMRRRCERGVALATGGKATTPFQLRDRGPSSGACSIRR